MASFLAEPERYVQLLAYAEPGLAVGLAEASIRNDYVNGTETSPVAFLEGIYVAPEHRRRGVAGSLVRAVAEWARARGCAELASDAGINDEASHMAHKAFGFRETERVVFFNMALR